MNTNNIGSFTSAQISIVCWCRSCKFQ